MTPSVVDIENAIDGDRLIALLRRLVAIPSENPPGDEMEAAEAVASFCGEIGLDVEQHEMEPGRPSVVARWSSGTGARVCFCSHLDVVPAGDPLLWEHDPYGATVHDGRLHGRGSADAKGPIAAALEATAALRSLGFSFTGTLELALVADEESGGFKGAGPLLERGLLRPDVVIVGEPTALRVVRAQRGIFWCRIVTRGRAAHGSAPQRGISAINHMAEIVLRLAEALPDVSHPVLGGPTVSVGTIHGGEKVNIVPASCVAEIDRRSIPGETDADVLTSIEAAVDLARKRFPEIDATVEVMQSGRPFEVPEDAQVVRTLVGAVAEVTQRDAEITGFRGASDARFFAEAGAEVALFGPGDIACAHTARESIDLEELRRAAIVYARAFAQILDRSP